MFYLCLMVTYKVKTCCTLENERFLNKGVPPYPLIQYPRFTAARKNEN
jgi:hypothetical protein